MANIVFQSADKLKQLNELSHPLVQIQFDIWLQQQQQAAYVIKEAALLIEAGSYQQLDELILVTCPMNKRIERVMKRDRVTEEEVIARINNQLSEEDKHVFCQYEIINDDRQLLIPQVLQLHHQLMRHSGQK
jgi:dephospho-CoA kinase